MGQPIFLSTTPLLVPPTPRKRSPAKYIAHIFGITFLVWILIDSPVFGVMHNLWAPIPTPPGLELVECIQGSEWQESFSLSQVESTYNPSYAYDAHKSFDLPLDADMQFLVARGSLAYGTVNLMSSPTVSDKVRVDISLQYSSQEVLDRTKVCLVRRHENEHGVGIFTPNHGWWRRDRALFTVNVIVPETQRPSTIKAFQTDMPLFRHYISDLANRVYFETLSLSGTNSPIDGESVLCGSGSLRTTNALITFKSLSADQIDIHTTNAAINGNYTSSGDISLVTTNGAIRVDADFGSAKSSEHATLDLTTTNSLISASVTAHTAAARINARTTNALLDVNVLAIPIDSALDLSATTSNHRVQISLPLEFEGAYQAQTSNAAVQLAITDGKPEDPKGEGRERKVERRESKGFGKGHVFWGDEGKDRGNVQIRSSNGAIVLRI